MSLTLLLPRTHNTRLRIAIVITCLSFWAYSSAAFYHPHPVGIFLGVAFTTIAVYLWLLRDWARKAARVCLGVALILFFFGTVLNPFFYDEYSIAHKTAWPLLRWLLMSAPF